MLPESMLTAWRRNGYVRLSGFFDEAQIDALRDWIDEVSRWPAEGGGGLHHFEETPRGPRLSRSEELIDHHEGLRQLLRSGSIVEAAGDLLGEPALLYKEKINYKHPGGGGYAAHQDAPAYEFVDTHVTCLVGVDPATEENGCLSFAAGPIRKELLPMDDRGCLTVEAVAQLPWEPVPTEPGDALFFSSYTPHFSPPNLTDEPRRLLYVTYSPAAAGDLRARYYADKRASLKEGRISKIGHFRGRSVEAPDRFEERTI